MRIGLLFFRSVEPYEYLLTKKSGFRSTPCVNLSMSQNPTCRNMSATQASFRIQNTGGSFVGLSGGPVVRKNVTSGLESRKIVAILGA
jgi:hypothetical protein